MSICFNEEPVNIQYIFFIGPLVQVFLALFLTNLLLVLINVCVSEMNEKLMKMSDPKVSVELSQRLGTKPETIRERYISYYGLFHLESLYSFIKKITNHNLFFSFLVLVSSIIGKDKLQHYNI